uniref:Uncharacterized protein n=1 Tax=Panagrolaimus superbus TaxID=310955 RepID=A0A914ZAD3_9BILA
MNQPPPLNANPARKSKQKVENTISISVHQPVDSDSDADLLNTDKKRNSVPQRKKQEGHGKEMPKRFTAQITQPILPSNQNNNGGGTDGINDSTRGGAAVNGVKRSKSSNYINDEQKNKQENMNVEKTAETVT